MCAGRPQNLPSSSFAKSLLTQTARLDSLLRIRSMETLAYRDFREFVEKAQEVSEWRLVEGADWDKEIGALIEVTAELPQPPMLVFDKIKDYPAGFRLVSLPYASYKRVALAFGLPADKSKLEIVRLVREK